MPDQNSLAAAGNWSVRDWVEIALGVTIPISCLGVIIHRFVLDRGPSARVIQFIGVIMIVPTVAILALEKILEGATVGTLLGGIAGYLLSGISNYDNKGGDSAK